MTCTSLSITIDHTHPHSYMVLYNSLFFISCVRFTQETLSIITKNLTNKGQTTKKH